MFGSQVIEVAVGLVFIFLLLSIACSGIKEGVASAFGMRAKTLENAIRNMLADPDNTITSRLFQNTLIAGTAQTGNKPSYISSRNFALALFDLLAPTDPTRPRTLQDLRSGIGTLPDYRLRTTLLGMLDSAQGDVDAARQKVENWYDDSMARVSGWYKRKAQIIILGAGFALCCLLNCDTLMIARELWSDQALRTVVMNNATAEAAKAQPDQKPSIAQIEAVVRNDSSSAPPLGWKLSTSDHAEMRGIPAGLIGWLKKILGVLISTMAVAMGAPFWFDALNKIVNLRMSGDPPKASAR
ncbi:MAG: hypothetical protein ABSF92_06765 [Candidatus Acidiferrales bacterium]